MTKLEEEAYSCQDWRLSWTDWNQWAQLETHCAPLRDTCQSASHIRKSLRRLSGKESSCPGGECDGKPPSLSRIPILFKQKVGVLRWIRWARNVLLRTLRIPWASHSCRCTQFVWNLLWTASRQLHGQLDSWWSPLCHQVGSSSIGFSQARRIQSLCLSQRAEEEAAWFSLLVLLGTEWDASFHLRAG